MKLVYNSETKKMEQVELTAEELAQSEIDKSTVIPSQPPSELELVKRENARLLQEDLNNKEAIAELYMMALGGF